MRADQGDELDIHAVYSGGLDRAWSRKRRKNARSRMSVRLVAQMGGSRHMVAEEMFWRGAAVVKLAELLEESSYRVEIVGADWHEVDRSIVFGDEKLAAAVIGSFIVKDAGAPMDIEAVAGVLCNAGFFRTYGFRAAYAAPSHALRGTQYEVQYDFKRQLGKTVRVPKLSKEGNVVKKKRTLLARTYNGGGNIVKELMLDADGTRTFEVPVSISNQERAQKWVRECLSKLESGEQSDDEE